MLFAPVISVEVVSALSCTIKLFGRLRSRSMGSMFERQNLDSPRIGLVVVLVPSTQWSQNE